MADSCLCVVLQILLRSVGSLVLLAGFKAPNSMSVPLSYLGMAGLPHCMRCIRCTAVDNRPGLPGRTSESSNLPNQDHLEAWKQHVNLQTSK